jgi:hypothetical protein
LCWLIHALAPSPLDSLFALICLNSNRSLLVIS